MTDKEYKALSIKEFSKAAKVYETDDAGVYKMCKKDYPDVLAELEKEDFYDLLDCGCGTAPMLTLLQKKYQEMTYCSPSEEPSANKRSPAFRTKPGRFHKKPA